MKNRGGTLSRTEEKERVFNPDEKVYRECFISLKELTLTYNHHLKQLGKKRKV